MLVTPVRSAWSLTRHRHDDMNPVECQRVSIVMDEQISIRFETEVITALKKAALDEDRTMAQEVRRVVVKHLQDKGYLPKPKKG